MDHEVKRSMRPEPIIYRNNMLINVTVVFSPLIMRSISLKPTGPAMGILVVNTSNEQPLSMTADICIWGY